MAFFLAFLVDLCHLFALFLNNIRWSFGVISLCTTETFKLTIFISCSVTQNLCIVVKLYLFFKIKRLPNNGNILQSSLHNYIKPAGGYERCGFIWELREADLSSPSVLPVLS